MNSPSESERAFLYPTTINRSSTSPPLILTMTETSKTAKTIRWGIIATGGGLPSSPRLIVSSSIACVKAIEPN